MAVDSVPKTGTASPLTGTPIVDCDVHNNTSTTIAPYLSERWRRYQELVGVRNGGPSCSVRTTQRPNASRLDAVPPDGGPPGSDPSFAREQLLDRYGISVAIINNYEGTSSGNAPAEFECDRARAINDLNNERWLGSDPRWRASISIATDHPGEAVKEIVRARELSDAFIQVIVGPMTERPLGNPKYWPIFEAAAHYDLPVAVHPMVTKQHGFSGAGEINYYFELRALSPTMPTTIVPSLIFEGVFERWPKLRVVLTECQWEWAVPLAWRMDSSWRVLREEVPHLQRKPSDYFRDHFWFTTQPSLETEHPGQVREAYQQFEDFGLGERMFFATDYPHWDMDDPVQGVPRHLSAAAKSRILWTYANEFYRLNLVPAA